MTSHQKLWRLSLRAISGEKRKQDIVGPSVYRLGEIAVRRQRNWNVIGRECGRQPVRDPCQNRGKALVWDYVRYRLSSSGSAPNWSGCGGTKTKQGAASASGHSWRGPCPWGSAVVVVASLPAGIALRRWDEQKSAGMGCASFEISMGREPTMQKPGVGMRCVGRQGRLGAGCGNRRQGTGIVPGRTGYTQRATRGREKTPG
jgi:hypothetical protein